jgi:hypothetical protein
MDSQETNSKQHIPNAHSAPEQTPTPEGARLFKDYLEDVPEHLYCIWLLLASLFSVLMPFCDTNFHVVSVPRFLACLVLWLPLITFAFRNVLPAWSADEATSFLKDAVIALSLPSLLLNILEAKETSQLGLIVRIVTLVGWYHHRRGLPLHPLEIVAVGELAFVLVGAICATMEMLFLRSLPYGRVQTSGALRAWEQWTIYLDYQHQIFWPIVACIGLWIQWRMRTPICHLVEMLAIFWTFHFLALFITDKITDLADTLDIFKPEFITQLEHEQGVVTLLLWFVSMVAWYWTGPIFAAWFGNPILRHPIRPSTE